MLSRLGASLALGAAMLLSAAAPAANAEDPVDLDGAYVLDTVGAISGSEGEVQAALDSLFTRADMGLFVVYVDSFTNPADPVEWADQTAVLNFLGTNDLLLAIATGERLYSMSIDDSFPLSDAQLDRVESAIEAELRDSDWSQAAIAGAQALEAEATGVVGPNQPTSTPAEPSTGSGGIPILPIVGGVAVVGVGVFVFSRIRRRGKDGAVTSAPEQMTQKQLDQRAGTLLVQLDDAVKTSEQELGFAVAQFGDAATKDFTKALESARKKVQEAFAIKQKLDDVQPDSTEERRAWTTQVIQLCETADAELDAQADAFDELRDLEKNAPQALAAVQEAATAATARQATATAALAALDKRYAAAALAPVSGNVEQAGKLLAYAGDAAKRAKELIDAGDASEAAIQVRTAQASVGQAEQLFAAIDSLGAELGTASESLKVVIADTTQDIAAATALPKDAALIPAITAASTALAAAQAAAEDPAAALTQLQAANASLEQVFVGVRDQQARVAQARSQLDATISTARAQVSAAMEYISTRRGGIGESARTRLSEADRLLAQASSLADSNPIESLAAAERANQLASSALSLARSDVEGFEARQSFDQRGGAYSGSDGADLGGLLTGWILGGGGSGGSSGGGRSSWGGGGSGRSTRTGSFGGSSRSSRRSGGGRSRGGRF
jgi:uncharacterized membrane protein YgcG